MSKIREHVSFSEFGMWNECQWRWMRDYREGRRAEVYSKYMTFGKCVHHSLELLKDPEKKEDRPSLNEACDIFEKKFRDDYKKIIEKDEKPLDDSGIEDFVLAGRRIIEHIDDCLELKDARTLFVELLLYEDIARTDDIDIKFKGYVDIVLKGKDKRGKPVVWIVDYKTCSWGWNSEKRRDEHLASQLRLYKHFFSKKFNVKPEQVKCAFVLLKRTPKGNNVIEWLPVSAGPKTVDRAVNKLNVAITGMHENNYKKNRNICVNKFGNVCPYYKSDLCTDD